jgi:hypothetical protein
MLCRAKDPVLALVMWYKQNARPKRQQDQMLTPMLEAYNSIELVFGRQKVFKTMPEEYDGKLVA